MLLLLKGQRFHIGRLHDSAFIEQESIVVMFGVVIRDVKHTVFGQSHDAVLNMNITNLSCVRPGHFLRFGVQLLG